jgi:hypothetical protein
VPVTGTRAGTAARRIALPAGTRAVALSPDGSRAYVCRGDQCDLLAIDTGTGRTVSGLARPGYDPESMAVSGDGSRLHAAVSPPPAPGEASGMPLAVTPARSRRSKGAPRSASARTSPRQPARTAGARMAATSSAKTWR